ncbi:hypothetical protein J6590_020525 [Homalodisca vitripennis]|nr:hypothetical protein J6590_020525 [Homalodisca vitripennis]
MPLLSFNQVASVRSCSVVSWACRQRPSGDQITSCVVVESASNKSNDAETGPVVVKVQAVVPGLKSDGVQVSVDMSMQQSCRHHKRNPEPSVAAHFYMTLPPPI